MKTNKVKLSKESLRLIKLGRLTAEQAIKAELMRRNADKEATKDYTDYEFDAEKGIVMY